MRAIALVLAVSPFTAWADQLILSDQAYSGVVVKESERAVYLLVPEDGTVKTLSKEMVADEAHVVRADDLEQDRLLAAWRAKREARRERAEHAKALAVQQSPPAQMRRELGARMAQEDLKRRAAHDIGYNRHDRRWQRADLSDEALQLLLSGEDESSVRLASMAIESQLVTQFVNLDLVERVRESWLRHGWHRKEAEARDQAIAVVTAVVRREARTSLERDATMAYIHRRIEAWE